MRDLFERHSERLTERERVEIWERIETARRGGSRGGARAWRPAAVGALALALIGGVLLVARLRDSRERGVMDLAANRMDRSESAVTDGGAPAQIEAREGAIDGPAESAPAPEARQLVKDARRDKEKVAADVGVDTAPSDVAAEEFVSRNRSLDASRPSRAPTLAGPRALDEKARKSEVSAVGKAIDLASARGAELFAETQTQPVSTFPLEVSRESYDAARASIDHDRLPSPGEVRVSDFVNAFRQDDSEEIDGNIAIHLDGAPSPFAPGAHVLRVGVTGPRLADARRSNAGRLAVVIAFDPSVVRRYRLLDGEPSGAVDPAPRIVAFATGEAQERKSAPAPGVAAAPPAPDEVSALYEVELVPEASSGRLLTALLQPADASAVASQTEASSPERIEAHLDVPDLASTFNDAPPRLRLGAVAAAFAEILSRGEGWNGNRIVDLLPHARRLVEEFPDDRDVAVLERIVERSALISAPPPDQER